MTPDTDFSLVIQPNIAFARLDECLGSQGWRRQADPTAPTPIVPGEPDIACWQHADETSRITYTFHPAMFLRVLTVKGEAAASIAVDLCDRIPILTIPDIRQILHAENVEFLLLGLHAANVLDAYELLGEVAALTGHGDELVAREAQSILQQLLQKAAAVGLEVLADWQTQHPGQSALFPLAGSPSQKRQVLRWLMQSSSTTNSAIESILRTALEDADWEVRATAMLAVGRLRVTALASPVRTLALPDAPQSGVDPTTRRMLAACRRAVLALLEGVSMPPPAATPPDTKEAMQSHILRCIAGEPVQFYEVTFLVIHALTTPLPDRWPLPQSLPDGIQDTATGYRLTKLDIPLCWVPPIPHWLGHDLPKMPLPNPIRLHHPTRGFFISQRLFVPLGESGDSPSYRCSWIEAVGWCDRIATSTQLNSHLPTPDQWEMAMRGPDGRLLPWGNGLTRPPFEPSPWGLEEFATGPGEWTCETASPQHVIAVGAAKPVPCALRKPTSPDQMELSFRLVIQQ